MLKVILVLWMSSAMLVAHGYTIHHGTFGSCYGDRGHSQRHCLQVHIAHP